MNKPVSLASGHLDAAGARARGGDGPDQSHGLASNPEHASLQIPPLQNGWRPAVYWQGGPEGELWLLDQTKLPLDMLTLVCREPSQVWEAIKRLSVRGAPAIGIAAAYGLVLAGKPHAAATPAEFVSQIKAAAAYLASSRPTAVNLFWALERMVRSLEAAPTHWGADQLLGKLLQEAQQIEAEDRQACLAIGQHGAELLAAGQGVLTHCNAGALATADYGTALAVIYAAQAAGKQLKVFADETRPLLQGARLTAWELKQRGVDVTLICDNMAGQVMREGRIQAVVVGADRIAANGDAANKIGTYSVAVLAQAHDIPFYVAAPSSTFDLRMSSGDQIPIEQRAAEEVTSFQGQPAAPPGIQVYNPAFDVTPARLIAGIITELGVIQPVTPERIATVLGTASCLSEPKR